MTDGAPPAGDGGSGGRRRRRRRRRGRGGGQAAESGDAAPETSGDSSIDDGWDDEPETAAATPSALRSGDTPRADTPRADTPRADTPRADTPRAAALRSGDTPRRPEGARQGARQPAARPAPAPAPAARSALRSPDTQTEESDEPATTTAWGTDDPGPAPAITLGPDLPADPPADDLDPSTAHEGDAPEPEFADLVNIVGVRLASAGRIYWCDAHDLHLARGERVIVEGEKGPRLAVVAIPPVRRPARDKHLRRVTRRASAGDLRGEADAIAAGQDLLRQAKARVKELRLPAKVFRVERHGSQRGGRVLVYYTSDDRVELRDLVRELGTATGGRVELRQLGVRDEAKIVGGIGSCGLELCCTTWLPEFVPVSIKMAKDQGMVLTPTKVSGQCGRLKCCLVYEQATYAEARKGLPKLGKRVITARGEGRVVEVDVLRGRVRVGYGPGDSEVLPGADVRPMFPSGPSGARPAAEPDEPSDAALDLPEMPTDDPSAPPPDGDDLD